MHPSRQTADVTPLIRRATAADLPAMMIADARGFGVQHSASDIEEFRSLFEPERYLLACEPDGTIVGTAGDFPFDVTLPGGATLPVPGVSWVSVLATHRRRGLLRRLFDEQHRAFLAAGAAVSLLTASEGGIYGRFGYGTATWHRSVEISRRLVTFRPDVPDHGGVRFADLEDLRKQAPDIHRRWAASTPAALSRSDAWWDRVLSPRESGAPRFHLLHPDGYASFRRRRTADDDAAHVGEVVAVTPAAHTALWRVLLSLDLVDTVHAALAPDDPLPDLLTDPRQVRTVGFADGMWARVLDVPAALAARRYGIELDLQLSVHDPFLDRGGRFRLRGGPDGAECVPRNATGAAPAGSVEIGMATLGTLLFGGRRAGELARAGLLRAADPAVLRRLDLAFLADRAPQHGTDF